MFVPGGYTPLLEAVETIALAIDARAMAAPKPKALRHAEVEIRPEASEPEIVRTSSNHCEARQRLRQALGDGLLRAVGMQPSGKISDIPIEVWRTDRAGHAMLTGKLRHISADHPSLKSISFDTSWLSFLVEENWPIFLPEAAFSQWLATQMVRPHSVRTERRLTEWLTSEMKAAPQCSAQQGRNGKAG